MHSMHSSRSNVNIFHGENISQPILKLNNNEYNERKSSNNYDFFNQFPNLSNQGRNLENKFLNSHLRTQIDQLKSFNQNLNFLSTNKTSSKSIIIDSSMQQIKPNNLINSSIFYMNDYKYERKSVVNRRNSLILKENNEVKKLKKSGSTLSILSNSKNKLHLPKID